MAPVSSSRTILALIAVATFLLCPTARADKTTESSISWHDAKTLTVEGRGWDDTAEYYDRLPARAEHIVPEAIWKLSKHSAGMVVRFLTDSPEINVRWKMTGSELSMHHFPSTGHSGIDLYVKHKGMLRELAIGLSWQAENVSKLISGLSVEKREYALYLPLYNQVSSVEIGIANSASIVPAPPHSRNIRPVVFYGSSITQGGCASRSGMAYTAIISRRLDIPIINLGFTAHGQCEHEEADLLADLNPEVYVIDCLPNMRELYVEERIRYLLHQLKQKHPDTPVVLVEEAGFQNVFIKSNKKVSDLPRNVILRKIYKDLEKEWANKLYYVEGTKLLGTDGEGTVDGLHPTDLGFQRMADVLTPALKRALDDKARR